ncbi:MULTISPECIES: hypothetical protein [unclassified Xanthobacter]|uniref:hypothetical protein n=1 Tax=unclassified Xanthobacter TaxID=2623496 RepID=UPI001EDFC00E|nr:MULTISPECIES: hypothetical protein [unclassified Xanthobacter]
MSVAAIAAMRVAAITTLVAPSVLPVRAALMPAAGEAGIGIVASALASFAFGPAATAAMGAVGVTLKPVAAIAAARSVMATMAMSFRKTAQVRLRIYFDAI